MNRLIVAGFLALLVTAAACGRSDLFEDTEAESPAAITVARYSPPPKRVPRSQAIAARTLIRVVNLELAVDDTEAASRRIGDLAAALGGYVGAADARRREGILSYSMTLHVPAAELDNAVASIKDMAETVDREHLSTEDVTDQVIDLDARLRTLNATEAELQGLLDDSGDRGDGLEDIMAVYRELTRIREQIEQFEAQLETLERRVALSAINLVLRPTAAARPVVVDPWSPTERARGSVRSLIRVLQTLGGFAIFFVIVILPVAVVVGVPAWGLVRLWERSTGRRLGQAPAPSGEAGTG